MSTPGFTTPKVGTPRTPLRSPANSGNYPFSSPYTSNTPIALPIHPPPMFKSEDLELPQDQITSVEIGAPIEELPFLTPDIQKTFKKSYEGILKNLNRLDKFNNIIVDMNESVNAYLFGLFQNAWCVHFDKTPNEEHWIKLNELEKLKLEAAELEGKIRSIREKKKRDSQRMPPPLPSSKSSSFKNTNLRPKINKPILNRPNQNSRFNRLKLTMAKKLPADIIDSSFESDASDTSGFISHPEPLRRNSLQSTKKSVDDNPFKPRRVRHKKPFR